MFAVIGVAPICVRADREVKESIGEHFTLPDNLRRTSGQIEVINNFCSDSREGKVGAKSGKKSGSESGLECYIWYIWHDNLNTRASIFKSCSVCMVKGVIGCPFCTNLYNSLGS